jgi:hypothetical protein
MPPTAPLGEEAVLPPRAEPLARAAEPTPAIAPTPTIVLEPPAPAVSAVAADEPADLGALPPLESDAERERKRQEGKPSPF